MTSLFAKLVLFSTILCLSSACTTYRKEDGGACADICLGSTVGVCPTYLIVKTGGLSTGSCADDGFTVSAGTISQAAGPCGTLTFNKYTHAEGLLFAMPSVSTRQLTSASSCPNPTTVDVDPAVYFSGRWYEIAASSGFKTRFENGLECITADYYFNKCNKENPVVVVNNGVKSDSSLNTAFGKARQTGAGKFEVSFFGPFYGSYWVIHTEASADFSQHVAIVYSCSSGSQDMWILSRTPTLPEGVTYDSLVQKVTAMGIDVSKLELVQTRQGDSCSYPSREALSGRPNSDDQCHLALTGCSPSSWCQLEFKWGAWPSCHLIPTDCEGDQVKMAEAATRPTQTDKKRGSLSTPVTAMIAVGAAVAAVAGIATTTALLRRRRPQISAEAVNAAFLRV